jgi:hypothetical protein
MVEGDDSDSMSSDQPYFRPSWAARRRARVCTTPEAQFLPAPSTEAVLSVGRTRRNVEELARSRGTKGAEEGEVDKDLARQLGGELTHAARQRSCTRPSTKPQYSETTKLKTPKKGERKWKTYREEFNETIRPANIANFWKRLAGLGELRGDQQFETMTDEEEEQDKRLEAVETRRLFATKGQAPPLWSGMSEFSGFWATQAYQRQRTSPIRPSEACETPLPSNNEIREAHSDVKADSETRPLSRRVRRPSRRCKESQEVSLMQAERSASRVASRTNSKACGETPASRPRKNTGCKRASIETGKTEPQGSILRQPSRKAQEVRATRQDSNVKSTTIETTTTKITQRETTSRKRRKTRGE